MFIKGNLGTSLKALDDAGKGVAIIATLNVKDKDNDIALTGAFGDDQEVKIVPAHNWSTPPLGKALIHEDGDLVMADFQLNLEIPDARDWHSALKFDLAQGKSIQEWSYGFTIVESEMSTESTDTRVRILKKLKVHEISPVVVGAGEGTRTVAIKGKEHGGTLRAQLADTLAAVENVAVRCAQVRVLREADGKDISTARREDLRELKEALTDMQPLIAHIEQILLPPVSDQMAEALLSDFIVASNATPRL